MVILRSWPLHCFLLCHCVSSQTLLFKLHLLWSIPAFLAFPPRFNFQTILWACCMLNSLQLCLLETAVFFVKVDTGITLSRMLNSILALKQFGSMAGKCLHWSHSPLPVSLSLLPLTSLPLSSFLLISSPHASDCLKQDIHTSCLMLLFEGLLWRPVMGRSEGCVCENAEITTAMCGKWSVLLLAQPRSVTGAAQQGGGCSPLHCAPGRSTWFYN